MFYNKINWFCVHSQQVHDTKSCNETAQSNSVEKNCGGKDSDKISKLFFLYFFINEMTGIVDILLRSYLPYNTAIRNNICIRCMPNALHNVTCQNHVWR